MYGLATPEGDISLNFKSRFNQISIEFQANLLNFRMSENISFAHHAKQFQSGRFQFIKTENNKM